MLGHVLHVVGVDREAHFRFRSGLRMGQALDELTCAIFEGGRTLVDGHEAHEADGTRERYEEGDPEHGDEQARPRRRRRQALGRARRRHQLRRGRLPRRQGGRERVATGQGRGDGERRGRAQPRILLQAPQDRALHRRIEIADDRGRPRRILFLVLPRQLDRALSAERAPSREQLVEHEAERVDVAAHRGLASRELLGGHVRGRARAHVVAAERFRQHRQAEVRDADLAAAVQHHVLGLEVAVQDVAVVGGRQTRAELARDVQRLVGR